MSLVPRMLRVLPLLALMACHGDVEMTPLVDRKIHITDRFYDVQAVTPEHVIVVGYGGKVLDSARAAGVADTAAPNNRISTSGLLNWRNARRQRLAAGWAACARGRAAEAFRRGQEHPALREWRTP